MIITLRIRFIYLVLAALIIAFILTDPGAPVNAAKAKALPGCELCALYPDLAEDLGLSRESQGLAVIGIYAGSPAEKAGVREGDLIVKIQAVNGKAVEVKDLTDYQKAFEAISDSKPVIFTILRQGQELTIELIRNADQFGGLVQPTAAAKPAIIKVAADGSGDCRTVEGALLRTRPGDTILLGPGQYSFANIGRDKLTLTSLDPQNPAVLSGIYLNGVAGIKMEGLTLVAANKGSGMGIGGSGKGIAVRNCRISNFASGISLKGTDVTVEDNYIHDNGSWAINIESQGSSVKISRNLVRKNIKGIWADGQLEISNNTVIENGVPSGEFLYRFHNGGSVGFGICIGQGGKGMVFNNISAFNNIGCLVNPNSQITLEYNDFYNQVIEEAGFIEYWGLFKHLEKKVQIRPANSNILSQIQSKNYPETYPIQPDLVVYTPTLLFPPSPTNLSLAPLFAESAKDDYRLAADSPLAAKGRGGSYIGAFPPVGYKPGTGTQNQPTFGISARPLTDADWKLMGLALVNGLLVTEVKKGSLAEKLQIKADDVILEINGSTFKDNEEFRKLIAGTITGVKVFRSGTKLVLTLPTEF